MQKRMAQIVFHAISYRGENYIMKNTGTAQTANEYVHVLQLTKRREVVAHSAHHVDNLQHVLNDISAVEVCKGR